MIQTIDLTPNEKKIIDQLRTMKPYETISIMADAQGRPDSYILTRTSKMLLINDKKPEYVKARYTLQE
jgi:hypothetical protein